MSEFLVDNIIIEDDNLDQHIPYAKVLPEARQTSINTKTPYPNDKNWVIFTGDSHNKHGSSMGCLLTKSSI